MKETIPAIPADLLPVYKEYLSAKAAADAAKARVEAAKAKILERHDVSGIPKFKSNGVYSTVYTHTTVTLIRDEIEKRFGPLPAECIKTTVNDHCIKIGGNIAE